MLQSERARLAFAWTEADLIPNCPRSSHVCSSQKEQASRLRTHRDFRPELQFAEHLLWSGGCFEGFLSSPSTPTSRPKCRFRFHPVAASIAYQTSVCGCLKWGNGQGAVCICNCILYMRLYRCMCIYIDRHIIYVCIFTFIYTVIVVLRRPGRKALRYY